MKNQGLRSVRHSTKFLKMFTSIIVLLGVSFSVSEAKKFEEANCKPRPTVVAVSEDYNLRPYHIVLHRCSGTFEKTSPTLKTCAVLEEDEVEVHVVNEHEKEEIRRFPNHTKCGSACTTTSCGDGMILGNECKCLCIGGECSGPILPTAKASRNDDKKPSLPLPYIVGMALVGFFAVFVLIFDAMLCVKQKGFMHTVKHSCACGKAHDRNMNDNQNHELEGMVSNGKAGKHTEV